MKLSDKVIDTIYYILMILCVAFGGWAILCCP
jgi:hypothetical protein